MTDRVVLRLRGHMLERFIGRALQDGVRFEEVQRQEGRQMRLIASEKDAARLLKLAEEFRMDLTVEGSEGLPCWRRRIKERGTLAPGLMLGLMIVVMFTSRIWQVEAVSLDGMAPETLLRAVEQNAAGWGAQPGVLRYSIDCDALAMELQAQQPELTHVGVRLDGVTLRVEVAVEEPAPEVYEAGAGRDLVALRDAVIVYVEPLAGKAKVQPGDTVRRGQVLIRGEERIDTEQTRGIRALGKVIGRVWFSASCDLPLSETVCELTGNSRTSAELWLGGWSRALSSAEDFASQQVETEILPIGGLYLPVKIVRTVRRETQEKRVPADKALIYAQGEAWALELARAELPAGAEETGCWVEFFEQNEKLTVRATVEAQMDIAAERSGLTNGS